MSSSQGTSKPSLLPKAISASALLLVGFGLSYVLRGDGDEPKLAPEPDAIASTEQAQATQSSGSYNRPSAFAARGAARGAAMVSVTTDPVAALAQLHANMKSAQARQSRDEMVAALESGHRSEPVDGAWSGQSEIAVMSASIAPVVLQAGFKPQNVAASCRSRTCRISADFTSAGDAEDWGDRVITQMGGTLSQVKMTIIQKPNGRSEVLMYGTRQQVARVSPRASSIRG
jgi:hypothetical protein